MNACRGVFFVTALLGLVACPAKDDDDKTPATPPTVPVAPPAQDAGPAEVKTDEPAKPKIEPRVKAEVDAREDGIAGSPLAVTGAKATVQAPTGWTTTKGDVTVSASADKKAQLGVTAFAAEGPTGKLAATTAALGLTACEWAPVEPVTVGKTKVASTAADGICTHGAAPAKAAYVATTAEGLLVVGVWDAGGDATNMFGAMQSIAKAGTGGDPTGIAACCAALLQNSKSAPPEQQGALVMAAGLCNSLKNDPQGRAVLSQVRAALAGAQAPSSCK